MNGKQLKNSILQWAIQGKLVPQDPNDEPASVLLERIRSEKARLIKEGKIKKDKNESIIYKGDDNSYYEKFPDGRVVCIDEEIPFEIPKGWEWERWGHISLAIQYGYNAPAAQSGNARMVRISDIQDNKLVWDTVPYCTIPEKDIDTYLLEPNDILFARTGGTVGKSFLVENSRPNTIYAGYLIRTRYNSIELCPKYLKAYMESQLYWEQLHEGTIATAQPNCNGQTLSHMLLPIPPHSEQVRITRKLSEIEPIVDAYKTAQERLDTLNSTITCTFKKSILQYAIQGKLVPQDSSDEPASALLERIATEKQQLVKEGKLKAKGSVSSIIFKGDDNKYYEQIGDSIEPIDTELSFPESWAVCRLSTICQLTDGIKRAGPGVCLDAKYLRGKSAATILQNGKYVRTGDNIILVDGENSGEVFPVPENGYMGSTFKQLWISETMCKAYVLRTIRFYKDALRNSKKGAAIPHLNKELFYNILIGIPPYQEQERISARIDELLSLLN